MNKQGLSGFAIIILFGLWQISIGLPLLDLDEQSSKDDSEKLKIMYQNATRNGTHKNLYVVKAVVYEIGILTDTSDEDSSSSSEEMQERVDLTFFDAHKNKSHINLGKIPLPVQTNISGQVLTGIVPVNIGAFSNPSQLLDALPLTGTIVNITHSDTAYFTLNERNASQPIDISILGSNDISKIPQISEKFPDVANNPEAIKTSFTKKHH